MYRNCPWHYKCYFQEKNVIYNTIISSGFKKGVSNQTASLNQTLNSGNQKIVYFICINYIYHKLGFFDIQLFIVFLFVLIDFKVFMYFFWYDTFVPIYVFIQFQVFTAFTAIAHFRIWIKITKLYVAGPCKNWHFGEQFAFISWIHKLLLKAILQDCTLRQFKRIKKW